MPEDWKNEELKRIKYFELYAKLKSKKYDAKSPFNYLYSEAMNDRMGCDIQ